MGGTRSALPQRGGAFLRRGRGEPPNDPAGSPGCGCSARYSDLFGPHPWDAACAGPFALFRARIFRRGPVVPALSASLVFPGAFRPPAVFVLLAFLIHAMLAHGKFA